MTVDDEVQGLRSDAAAAARTAYAISHRSKRPRAFTTQVLIKLLGQIAGKWRVEATRLENAEQERRWQDG